MGKEKKGDLPPSDDGDDDIDRFYEDRDENLRTALTKTTKKSSKNKKSVSWALDNNMSDDENGRDEVLAFDDDDDDSMNTDDETIEYPQLDDEDEDEDLSGAWGSSKKAFYNEDPTANDDDDAKLEQLEAEQIQKRYYEMIQKNDLGLDLFQEKPSTSLTDAHLDEQSLRRHIILPSNLLELSSNERLQLIRDQSPELETLCHEYKTIFDDLKIYLLPFVQLVLDTSSLEEFQTYSGWQFILAILELYLVYCSYLSLYLTMKSKDNQLIRHPILSDIDHYRKLTQLVDEDFQTMKSEILKLCELLQERKSQRKQQPEIVKIRPQFIVKKEKPTNGVAPKVSLRERMTKRREEVPQEIEEKPEKRAITYQIQKNKGLTVKRKKENRNPRVHHRNKYARALVKRKSRVPTARTEEEKYSGEPTGIRAGIKRGIKLKS